MSWLALLLALLLAAPQDETDATEQQRIEAARAKRVELLLRWKESLELGLPAEVVQQAGPLVESDGALRTDGEALALYAEALAATGGAARARELLEASEPSPRTQPAVEVALARLDLAADRLRAVEERLAAPEGADPPVRYPERAGCWLVLGRARVRAGEAARARPLLETFVEHWSLHPEAPSAWHMLAQEALGRRDVERAKECRERAEQLASWHAYYRARRLQMREHPADPLPRLGLAQLWIAVDELTRARAALEELVLLRPDFCRGWATLGEVLRKGGDAKGARAAYDRALDCDAELHEVRFNRALLALTEDRKADARADFEALVAGPAADDERLLDAHLFLARLLLAAGEEDAARARYDAYVARGGSEPLGG
jgi:predicted Zn-dependent protease